MDAGVGFILLTSAVNAFVNLYNASKQRQLQAKQHELQAKQYEKNRDGQKNIIRNNTPAAETDLKHQRELQREHWEQQKDLDHQKHLDAIELTKIKDKMSRDNQEYARMLDAWPLKNTPSQIVQYSNVMNGVSPLTVLIAPPRWKRLPSDWDQEWVEQILANNVSQFLRKYFPFYSPRPVHLVSGTWKEHGMREQAAIDSLFHFLEGHPTLVLESFVIRDEVDFWVGQWNDEKHPTYMSVGTLPIGHRPTESVLQELTFFHCFLTICSADLHFLIAEEVRPQLPTALPELIQLPKSDDLSELLRQVVHGYEAVYQEIIRTRPAWAPEIQLDLAESLAGLPDKSYARDRVEGSMRSWLRLRNTQPDGVDTYQQLLPLRRYEDKPYFERLHELRQGLVTASR